MNNSIPLLYALVTATAHAARTTAVQPINAGLVVTTRGHAAVGADMRELAARLGVSFHDIRTPMVEYHPGALMEIGRQIEEAMAADSCIFLLDEADAAATGVLEAIVRLFPDRREDGRAMSIIVSVADADRSEDVAAIVAETLHIDSDLVLRSGVVERLSVLERQDA